MIKHLMLLAFFTLFLPHSAQATVKDSFYFMKDDGIFSAEEKDEEAEYIFEQCARNPFQNLYFDCACIAGDFRLKRDEENLRPQGTLLDEVLMEPDNKCINTIGIAGESYQDCLEFSESFRSRNKNNEQYCSCVGNKTARDFQREPVLRLRHIERLRSNAMATCARTYP